MSVSNPNSISTTTPDAPRMGVNPSHDPRLRAYLWLVIASLAALSGCATNPITGRSQLALATENAAISSSASAYSGIIGQFSKKGKIEAGTARVEKVKEITNRLVAEAVRFRPDSASWNWEVTVINEPKVVNAFCMAGGKMGIYTGIWEKLGATDDEIAIVMGHEISHALANHTAETMSVAMAVGIGAAVAAGVASRRSSDPNAFQRNRSAIEIAAVLAITLPHSREAETEADQIGIELAAKAGYDPQAAVSLWKKMAAQEKVPFEFLSTHPSPDNRVQRMETLVAKVDPFYRLAIEGKSKATIPTFIASSKNAQDLGVQPSTRSSSIQSLRQGRGEQFNALRSGVDSNTPSILGNRPYPDLMTAVMSSNKNAVNDYILQGADLNQRQNGTTYLIAAVSIGDMEMVQFLVSKGAEVNQVDTRGFGPIVYAMTGTPPNAALTQFLESVGAKNPFKN